MLVASTQSISHALVVILPLPLNFLSLWFVCIARVALEGADTATKYLDQAPCSAKFRPFLFVTCNGSFYCCLHLNEYPFSLALLQVGLGHEQKKRVTSIWCFLCVACLFLQFRDQDHCLRVRRSYKNRYI